MKRLALLLAALAFFGGNRSHASTAAFGGEVTEVKPAEARHKETLLFFTTRIDYYDYCSWSKFGRDSKVGEPITRQVKKLGTAGMLDGRLVNAAAFAKAIRPGLRGYFYEDTWLDLHLTPDFLWGEILAVNHDKKTLRLRVHRANKEIHLAANPPVEKEVSFGGAAVRIEEKKSSAAEALKPGNWLQVHRPRPQIVSAFSSAAAFDPAELLPQEAGKRGYANDLTCHAVLHKLETKTPDAFIDLSADLTVTRTLKGATEELVLNARKTTFVLDGKVAPAKVAARPGRNIVLGHYRSEARPHKVFVRSFDDSARGRLVAAGGDSLRIAPERGLAQPFALSLDKDATLFLDGVAVKDVSAFPKGCEVTVRPAAGLTLAAFPPYEK